MELRFGLRLAIFVFPILSGCQKVALVAPSDLAYSESTGSYTKGSAITALTATCSGGEVESYAIDPALPSGLTLDTSTGEISGTPTVVKDSGTYTVTATNTAGSATSTLTLSVTGQWTWVSGASSKNSTGVYGTKGTAASTNIPGARDGTITWIDASNHFWLFGGVAYDSTGNSDDINDLWKFDGTNWTWISGSDTRNQTGTYGTLGTAAGANIPGARDGAVSWIDSSGNFWLHGGYGKDSAGNIGYLNDLWKFDQTNWTWISGANTRNQSGTYGTKGTAAGANKPGGRAYGVSWIDSSGNIWLLGGYGYDSAGTFAYLNDLWKFDGTNWTWVSGRNTAAETGVYGTKGTAAASNVPGARQSHMSAIDSSGNFWLFGGDAKDSAGNIGQTNDLWKFDGTLWTWISGADTRRQSGTYGTQGSTASTNVPGARQGAALWFDSAGVLWLFGGRGYDSSGTLGGLNDLWKFDGSSWTWISGSNTSAQTGTYGTLGMGATTNTPGARYILPAGKTDSSGNFWVFGGLGFGASGTIGDLNDLWKF